MRAVKSEKDLQAYMKQTSDLIQSLSTNICSEVLLPSDF